MKAIRAISSLLLAALVLFATSSFYVELHRCGGHVKAIALLHEADGCGHQTLPPCHREPMKGCCENDQITHDSQEIKGQLTTVTLPILSAIDVIHNTLVLAEIVPVVTPHPSHYFSDHPPALHGRDILIANQSFLI